MLDRLWKLLGLYWADNFGQLLAVSVQHAVRLFRNLVSRERASSEHIDWCECKRFWLCSGVLLFSYVRTRRHKRLQIEIPYELESRGVAGHFLVPAFLVPDRSGNNSGGTYLP